MNRRSASGADAGAGTIWVVACGALLLVIAVVVTVRTTAVLARHRVEAAADLAALAAAGALGTEVDPCGAAARIATANGAVLVACTVAPDGPGGSVSVQVSRDVVLGVVGHRSVVASARAGRESQPATPVPASGTQPATSGPGTQPGTRPASSVRDR